MNPEERLRRIDDPERWDLPIRRRPDAFPPKRRPSPLLVSVATIAAVAVAGIVVFTGFGSGVRSLLHQDLPVATTGGVTADVPWSYQSAVATPDSESPVLKVVPVCRASDVTIASDGGGVESSSVGAAVSLMLIVMGNSACSLDIASLAVEADGTPAVYSPAVDYVAPVVAPHQTVAIDANFDTSCEHPDDAGSFDRVPLTATLAGLPVHDDGSATVLSKFLCSGKLLGGSLTYTPLTQSGQLQNRPGQFEEVGDVHEVRRGATSVHLVVRFNDVYNFQYPICPVIIAGTAFGDKKSAVSSTLNCNSPSRQPSGTWAFDVPVPEGAVGSGIVEWSMPGSGTLTDEIKIK